MSAEPERNPLAPGMEGDSYVREQLAAMDGDLMRRIPSDARLESGVPEGQLSGALDFIQMTGLTRPPARKRPPGLAADYLDGPARPDIDTSAPLSFYEKGVADVDESMGEGGFDSGLRDAGLDANLVVDRGADRLGSKESNSAKAFRDIIAELESGMGVEPAAESVTYTESDPAPPDDTEAALRALANDLASEAAPAAGPRSDGDVWEESTALEVPLPEEGVLPEPGASEDETPLVSAPEPEPEHLAVSEPLGETSSTDSAEDFDDLLASLDTGSPVENGGEPATEIPGDEPAPDDLTEDWDALLDSVALEGHDGAPAPALPGRGSLAEAEQLMHVLSSHPAPAEALSPGFSDGEGVTVGETALPYDYSAVPSRRRSRRHSRLARRGWRLFKFALLLCAAAGAGVYLWWFVLAPMMEKTEDLEADAGQLMASKEYVEASAAYLQLARRPSADRADARFRAAYALTLNHHDLNPDQTRECYGRALEIFETFVEENPEHPKHTRALCLMGRLQYELGNYDAAIAILRDRVKPVDDPAAALAMLRYLARSYKMTGAYEEAETSYLQAATLPGNYSAETDYLELGEMFRTRAGLADDPAVRAQFEETAVAYWNRGIQVPGIAPEQLDALQERLAWSAFSEESGLAPAAEEPASPAAEAIPAPEAHPAPEGSAASPLPAPEVPGGRVSDPGIEIQEMIPKGGAYGAGNAPVAEAAAE